jgi:hypothetical protein
MGRPGWQRLLGGHYRQRGVIIERIL